MAIRVAADRRTYHQFSMSRLVLGVVALSITEALCFVAPVSRSAASAMGTRAGNVRAADEVSDWGVDNLFEMMEEADEKISGLDSFLTTLKKEPTTIDFEQTMAAIEEGYDYSAVKFTCGELDSSAEQNQGSAKIFSFAKLQKLKKEATLELFGRFYRDDVRAQYVLEFGSARLSDWYVVGHLPVCMICASAQVLKSPDGTDHGNIRNFMKTGWDGVSFPDGLALKEK